jgi:inositol phosphorylceramide mannosyltransferase catalytic subunit
MMDLTIPQTIPRVIHQTWKERSLPQRYGELSQTWRRAHPEWQWRLWTDADNLAFVEQHYPALLNTYLAFPYPIQRVDLIRYLILHRFGGIYVDLDFECYRALPPLLQGRACVLSLEAAAHNRVHGRRRIVSNAFMAAIPGHPLFAAVIDDLHRHRSRETVPDRIVLDTTGPMMLTRVLDRLGKGADVTVLAPRHLFPLSMDEADGLRAASPDAAVARKLARAYGMHWHDGTWWRPEPSGPRPPPPGALARLRRRLRALLSRTLP